MLACEQFASKFLDFCNVRFPSISSIKWCAIMMIAMRNDAVSQGNLNWLICPHETSLKMEKVMNTVQDISITVLFKLPAPQLHFRKYAVVTSWADPRFFNESWDGCPNYSARGTFFHSSSSRKRNFLGSFILTTEPSITNDKFCDCYVVPIFTIYDFFHCDIKFAGKPSHWARLILISLREWSTPSRFLITLKIRLQWATILSSFPARKS